MLYLFLSEIVSNEPSICRMENKGSQGKVNAVSRTSIAFTWFIRQTLLLKSFFHSTLREDFCGVEIVAASL